MHPEYDLFHKLVKYHHKKNVMYIQLGNRHNIDFTYLYNSDMNIV